MNLELTYTGSGSCYKFEGSANIDLSFTDAAAGVTSTRTTSAFNAQTGVLTMGSPGYYERATNGQASGNSFPTVVCGRYANSIDGETVTAAQVQSAVTNITAACLSCP